MTPPREMRGQYGNEPEGYIGRNDGIRYVSSPLKLLHDLHWPKGTSLQFNRNDHYINTAGRCAQV